MALLVQHPSAAFSRDIRDAANPVVQVVFSSDNAFILILEDSPLITSLMERWTAEIQGVMSNSRCNKKKQKNTSRERFWECSEENHQWHLFNITVVRLNNKAN